MHEKRRDQGTTEELIFGEEPSPEDEAVISIDLEGRIERLRQAAVGFALASPLDLKKSAAPTTPAPKATSLSEVSSRDEVRRFVSSVLDYETSTDT